MVKPASLTTMAKSSDSQKECPLDRGSNSWALYNHTSYLSFFLHEQNFWRIKFTPKKRVNYDKIHRKLPNLRYYGKIHSKLTIFRVKSVKNYTGQTNMRYYQLANSCHVSLAITDSSSVGTTHTFKMWIYIVPLLAEISSFRMTYLDFFPSKGSIFSAVSQVLLLVVGDAQGTQ